MLKRRLTLYTLIAVAALVLAGCAGEATPAATEEAATEESPATEEAMVLEGDVVADGSSTVFPLSTAVAEEFALVYPDVRVSVGLSGTGGGFEKFCNGETDISNASRAIRDSEVEACAANGIEFSEYLVGLDGLSVMVNPDNDWVQCLTVEQLSMLFRPDAENNIDRWSELDPSFPDEPILFFTPDPDSGTYDFFIEAILEGMELPEELLAMRQDEQTTFSSDDNVLLDGIANEPYAIGYFGYAYYVANPEAVRLVAVENGDGACVEPSDATVSDGTYNPLSRPLFIYANNASLVEKPQMAAFVEFYLSPEGATFVMPDVGYSLPPAGSYEAGLETLAGIVGE
jgi:phosphate transport system substrate-binding protein